MYQGADLFRPGTFALLALCADPLLGAVVSMAASAEICFMLFVRIANFPKL
jgi:hypothetical protein